MFRNTILAASAVLLSTAVATAGDESRPFKLMVGDNAPTLTVEWVKGAPVQSLQGNKTYVVEFWATWCRPCIKAMPHLSSLQEKYADSVTVIGVNVWEEDQKKVHPFVDKMGDKMAYTVAMDIVPEVKPGQKPAGKMATSWLDAAGREGIPSSFIVKGGKVQWIGHPGEMDAPLEKVVAGSWDLERATADHREAIVVQSVRKKLGNSLQMYMRSEKWSEAIAELDAAFQKHESLEQVYGPQKLFCLIRARDNASSMAYAEKLIDGAFKDNPQGLNIVAWMIVDPKNTEFGLDVAVALRAGKQANELTSWKEPAALDTYSLALFLSGDVAKAVETQEIAVKMSIGTPYEADLKKRLEEFRAKRDAQG
jgi:thiol-disulfide isomerase/thioredoxin